MKSIVGTAQNATENWPKLVAQKDNRIAELEALVKYYEEQFRLAKHRQFGASSEKSAYDFGQLCLFNETELFLCGIILPITEWDLDLQLDSGVVV